MLPSGEAVLGWIEWEDETGEHVVVSVAGETSRLDSEPADCFRPTVAVDARATPWIFYGRSEDEEVAVYGRRCTDGRWSDPERVSDSGHPSFNQEVAAHDDGSVEVVWQGRVGGRFEILARRWIPESGWAATVDVT
jgi:hypothetical protein